MGGRGASQGRALGRSQARLAGRSATGFGGQGGREAQVAPVGNVCPHHGQHAHVGSAWHLPHAAQNLTCGAPCGGGRAAAAAPRSPPPHPSPSCVALSTVACVALAVPEGEMGHVGVQALAGLAGCGGQQLLFCWARVPTNAVPNGVTPSAKVGGEQSVRGHRATAGEGGSAPALSSRPVVLALVPGGSAPPISPATRRPWAGTHRSRGLEADDVAGRVRGGEYCKDASCGRLPAQESVMAECVPILHSDGGVLHSA